MSLQPAEASWSSLPEPLAARILQSAFYDSDRALSQRARMSLVCSTPRPNIRLPHRHAHSSASCLRSDASKTQSAGRDTKRIFALTMATVLACHACRLGRAPSLILNWVQLSLR